jgi:hypothetical protein
MICDAYLSEAQASRGKTLLRLARRWPDIIHASAAGMMCFVAVIVVLYSTHESLALAKA